MSSFVKSYEEIERKWAENKNVVLNDGKALYAFWETKKEILERIIPSPLKPLEIPVVMSFIADWENNDSGEPYRESALFTRVTYEGVLGTYYFGMHVTDDRALFDGREYQGFPKKIADIQIETNGDIISATSQRRGTVNLGLGLTLDGEPNENDALEIVAETGFLQDGNAPTITYLFKHFFNPERTGFDSIPRLISQETMITPKTMDLGKIDIQLNSSVHDPWGEVEVIRPLGGAYIVVDVLMLPAKGICEVDANEFLPYAFNKWD